MPRPKPTEEDLLERRTRREEWLKFRKDNLFTQVILAEILEISRRKVQFIEAAELTPLMSTLRKFRALKAKYDAEKVA